MRPEDIEASRKRLLEGVYKEVDGFYYFDPPCNSGCYSASNLREIADAIDGLNRPWELEIDEYLNDLGKNCEGFDETQEERTEEEGHHSQVAEGVAYSG